MIAEYSLEVIPWKRKIDATPFWPRPQKPRALRIGGGGGHVGGPLGPAPLEDEGAGAGSAGGGAGGGEGAGGGSGTSPGLRASPAGRNSNWLKYFCFIYMC